MYDVIKRYCEDERKNGLLLLNMPTGTGKTHTVLQYIFDSVQNPTNTQKYFFITTLKKNLPEDDLRSMFEKDGKVKMFENKFLRVDSYYESVIHAFQTHIEDKIPDEITGTDEYKKLKDRVDEVIFHREKNGSNIKNYLMYLEDEVRLKLEPSFRHMIQVRLKKNFSTVKERAREVKTNSKWKWVAEMYPTFYLNERQIIFMSMDKFLTSNSTIVGPSEMLYNSDIIKDAVIFIDEFDATKETVLKKLIQDGLNKKVNYIDLFSDIYSALHTHTFPAALTESSKKRQNGKYKDSSLQDVLGGTTRMADEIYNMFSLQYSYKTEDITDNSTKNFLFQDHQFFSILNGDNQFITFASDKRRQINEIHFSEKKPEGEENNVYEMLGKIHGFISYFMTTVDILANNYLERKNEENSISEFSREEAVRTVLSEFHLKDDHVNYLTPQILMKSFKSRTKLPSDALDTTYYERGFRYYSFEDNSNHDMQSAIRMYSFDHTPEKMLLLFCKKAKVMGISATATIPSKIGNYDIDYLKMKLQDGYFDITEEEKSRINKIFYDNFIEGYERKGVNIHVELIGEENYSDESWRSLIDNEEKAASMCDEVNLSCRNDNKNYLHKRYLRIALAFKAFMQHDDIKSFLCVLTKHPRENDNELDMDVLRKLFCKIAKEYDKPDDIFDVQNNVVQLDGDEYDAKKDEIIKRLSEGEKIFVISVYQTIGAGQNLQYPVPEKVRDNLVRINDRNAPGKEEKDFDAIYLDKPTNLIPHFSPYMKEEDFVKYLFYVEMLQENKEISVNEAKLCVKEAFRSFGTGSPQKYLNNPDKAPSVILLSTRVIIQAIGRICRTNLKSRNIYVFADSQIKDRIDTGVCRGGNFNREFEDLVDKLFEDENKQGVDNANVLLYNGASLKSSRIYRKIQDILRNKWTEESISCWNLLRNYVLKYPTTSKDKFDAYGIAHQYYVEMPKENDHIFYTEEDDYRLVDTHFVKKGDNREYEESAESSKLLTFMRFEPLREYFEENGYATTFSPNKYIMAPPLFNNIYRGALGEAAGKMLFRYIENVKLSEITDPEEFEKFDFTIPGTSIYVDFKNWHESFDKDWEKEVAHIEEKAQRCKAECVIVANIYAKNKYKISTYKPDEGGIEVIVIPALLSGEEKIEPVNESWDRIRRCIREYSNTDNQA